jgi:hypothetical protein
MKVGIIIIIKVIFMDEILNENIIPAEECGVDCECHAETEVEVVSETVDTVEEEVDLDVTQIDEEIDSEVELVDDVSEDVI